MDAFAHLHVIAPAIERSHSVKIDGVCSIDGGPDVACRATKVSLARMTVQSKAPARFLEPVTLQLPHIGIIEAVIAEAFAGGFDLVFESAPHSKLGRYIAWLDSAEPGGSGIEGRQHERIVPIKRITTLKRRNMPPSMVRIVDLSRSGAAFTCGNPLESTEHVELGARGGYVVRLFEGGAAVRFDDLISDQDFGVLIDLDVRQQA